MRFGWKLELFAVASLFVALRAALGAAPSPAAAAPLTAAPVVSRVFADGLDVIVAWYGVKGAVAYEVLRSASPAQPAATVVKLPNTSLGYRDKQAGSGPLYYQVVAVGADGTRLSSPWVPFNAPSGSPATAGTSASAPTLPRPATGATLNAAPAGTTTAANSAPPVPSLSAPAMSGGSPNPAPPGVGTAAGTAPAGQSVSTPATFGATVRSAPPGTSGIKATAAAPVPSRAGTVVGSAPTTAAGLRPALPGRTTAYLTKNNGGGSAAAAALHLASGSQAVAGQSFDQFLAAFDLNYDGSRAQNAFIDGPSAWYANVTELGLGRDVACWLFMPLSTTATVPTTVCVAGNHGIPGSPKLPDGPSLSALAASTRFAPIWVPLVNEPTQYDRSNCATWDHPASYSAIVISGGNQYFLTLKQTDPKDCSVPPLTRAGFWDSWQTRKLWSLATSTTLDSEGPKFIPHACLSCHGGRFDPQSGKVTGATLLPIDPGLVIFSAAPDANAAAQADLIRQLNAAVLLSQPAPAVAEYVKGLYGGVPDRGAAAQQNYVPAAWSQQSELFLNVVKSNCLMCHLATPVAVTFESADKFLQNSSAIYADVCTSHVMPNAEVPYQRTWTSTLTIGNRTMSVGEYLFLKLGYTGCP